MKAVQSLSHPNVGASLMILAHYKIVQEDPLIQTSAYSDFAIHTMTLVLHWQVRDIVSGTKDHPCAEHLFAVVAPPFLPISTYLVCSCSIKTRRSRECALVNNTPKFQSKWV
jgi:hypothetical protein